MNVAAAFGGAAGHLEDTVPGSPEEVDFGLPVCHCAEYRGYSFYGNFRLSILVFCG